MACVTSDNLRPVKIHYNPKDISEFVMEPPSDVNWTTEENKLRNALKAARYSMHKVRLFHYQCMVKLGELSPDLAKQYYLAAMQNFDDVTKSAQNGSFNEAMDREMEAFDVNEAFSGR